MNRVEEPELEFFIQEMRRLVPNRKDWPEDDDCLLPIVERIYSRRKTNVPSKELWPHQKAELLASVIPKVSIKELEKKAQKGDADALLSLGDCYFFNLIGCQMHPGIAMKYYQKAAELNQPEAILMDIYFNYAFQQNLCSMSNDSSMPTNLTASSGTYNEAVKEMWNSFEKLIDLDWITPYFYSIAVLSYFEQN